MASLAISQNLKGDDLTILYHHRPNAPTFNSAFTSQIKEHKGTVLISSWRSSAVVFGVYAAFWATLAVTGFDISHEHGPMENAQAWCLLFGAVIFAVLSFRQDSRNWRILFASLSLFYFSFVLREVEVEDLNIPSFLIVLGSGDGKKYLLLTCWAVAFGLFVCHRRSTWLAFKQWLGTMAGTVILLGGVFYFLGMPFDKKVFGLEYQVNVLLEEYLETIATFWMLLAAIFSRQYLRLKK